MTEDRLKQVEQALEEERRARAALEITNASLQRENEFLRTQFQAALENERNTLKMLANISMQSRYGMTPFPEAKGLPEDGAPQPIEQPSAKVQGVDIVRDRVSSFVSDYRKKFDKGEVAIPPSVIEQFAMSI